MKERGSFGYWLRRRRRALDLTQEALAQQVSCALATIRKLEADERRPSRELAARLADALSVPAAEREAFLRAARALDPDAQQPLAAAPIEPHSATPNHNLPAQLTTLIGSGSSSLVYDAYDVMLSRRVTIKVVEDPTVGPEALIHEARALAAVRHPGLPVVYGVGSHQGRTFLVLERVHVSAHVSLQPLADGIEDGILFLGLCCRHCRSPSAKRCFDIPSMGRQSQPTNAPSS